MSVVMDLAAILAFLEGNASELLAHFETGVEVSDVTVKELEWHLIRSGSKRLETRSDLARLGLSVTEFSERFLEHIHAAMKVVPGLSFEAATAASLAHQRKALLLTGFAAWSGVQFGDLEVQLIGSARVVPPSKPEPALSSASVDGGVSHETRT